MVTTKAGENVLARIGDAAVKAKTGRTWREWFAILDEAGATQMDHRQIVAYLGEHHRIAPWWQQMVTVGYEQERGLRQVHQTPTGYQVSASKTVSVPIGVLFDAWEDPRSRARWLPGESLSIRKSTPFKSMRVLWSEGATSLDINFYPRGESKSQVSLSHTKLADAAATSRMKAYWAQRLAALKECLEG